MHTFTLAILLKKHGPCQTKKNKSKLSLKPVQNGIVQVLWDRSKSNYFFTN